MPRGVNTDPFGRIIEIFDDDHNSDWFERPRLRGQQNATIRFGREP
jgi:hypothetical protein